MAFGNSILGGGAPASILGGGAMPPRIPWGQNRAVTMAALGMLGAPTLNEGMRRAATLVPAGLDANQASQQFAMAQQEKATAKAEQDARRAQLNEVMKAWPGLSPEHRALFTAQPELFGQYAVSTLKPQETFRPLTDPTERAKFGIGDDDKAPYQVGPDNKVYAIGGGGTNISVDTVGTIPQGYELVTDPASGAKRMRPIPGGPADTSKTDAARQEQKGRYGDVVLEDIRRAKEKVKNQTWYAPVTGVGAQVLGGVGGSAAKDTGELISTIEASIAFDRLQAMRESSPTGGALGAVTERELALLKATLGSLDQSQSEDQLIQNLDRLEDIYSGIMEKAAAYPNAAQFGFASSTPATPNAGVYDWSPDAGLRPVQ